MMTKRWMPANEPSYCELMENAMIGVANATPTTMATITLGTRPHERVSGKQASTLATAAAASPQRTAIHVAWPSTMSPASSGVAAMPW